jgi:hypothetical protein
MIPKKLVMYIENNFLDIFQVNSTLLDGQLHLGY